MYYTIQLLKSSQFSKQFLLQFSPMVMNDQKSAIKMVMNKRMRSQVQASEMRFSRRIEGVTRRVARNSQWGGYFRGLGSEPPAAGGWGFGGKAPSRRSHGSLGWSPQRSKILHFFAKITSFRAILIKKNALKTWLRNWQCKHD